MATKPARDPNSWFQALVEAPLAIGPILLCPGCDPQFFPTGGRLHPFHLADRFKDLGGPIAVRTTVLLDHQPYTRAIEVCPGDPGWLLALENGPCPACGARVRYAVQRGLVNVLLDIPAGLPSEIWSLLRLPVSPWWRG